MKSRWLRNLTLTTALLGAVSLSSTAWAAPAVRSFADVPIAHPGYDSINALAQRAIVIGYEDGMYHPDATIARAEFAIMLNRAFGTSGQNAQTMFADVDRNAWYAAAIRATTYNGTILATDYRTGNGMFLHPEEPITRAEIAAWVARALTQHGVSLNVFGAGNFPDLNKSGRFNYEIREMATEGIVKGDPEGTFRPDDSATRAEAAIVLQRALAKFHL